MIDTVKLDDSNKWDEIVKLFPNHDVYYLSGYVKAFAAHGDGNPILVHYSSEKGNAICVLMLRDIADDSRFDGRIPRNEYYDAVTPYGYGGFLMEGNVDESVLALDFEKTLKDLGVISVFYRFHPVLSNAKELPNLLQTIPLGKTIALDLSSPQLIWDNIISKNRNMIRKAEKEGVEIFHGKGLGLLKEFREIYNATMDKDNAESYYYFNEGFYNSIDRDLKDNYEIFYATYQGEIIAMSIMIFANGYMNYHLSGSKFEFRKLAPSNLLLYKAAIWGSEEGMNTFHLGGGLGSGEDNLYKFKAAFNRNSNYRFTIGKSIIDKEKYDFLMNLRSSFDNDFNPNSSFFPVYRS